MFISNETNRRVNIYQPYKGFSKLNTPEIRQRAGVIEIADPVPPADYSDETYYRTEQDDAPYVIYTKKSDEQLLALRVAKLTQLRDEQRFNGGVKVGNLWFRSDAIATSEYTALVIIGSGLPDETVLRAGWRTMSGETTDMTVGLVKQILSAGFANVAAIDDVWQAKKLDDTPINEGWPERYSAD
jgi:hypothetical protein